MKSNKVTAYQICAALEVQSYGYGSEKIQINMRQDKVQSIFKYTIDRSNEKAEQAALDNAEAYFANRYLELILSDAPDMLAAIFSLRSQVESGKLYKQFIKE